MMAAWAAVCAERVLPFFERVYPEDDRPRKAIETCRRWIQKGIFSMAEIRGASLAAHAAARESKENKAACFAARAAGQAVATAHVAQHAFGGSYYALKAVAAVNPENTESSVMREFKWQSRQLPDDQRDTIMRKIIIRTDHRGMVITIQKDDDY